jgi:MFS superfamily sulfate permease-like transporter
MLMVVFVGVEQGIILAIVLSLIDHTRRGYRPKNVVMVPSESGLLQARPVATHTQALPGLLIYRFTHSMYYANAEQLSEEITDLANNSEPPLRWLCLDASSVDDVDYSAAETLRSLFAILKDKGIRLVVAQVLDDVRDQSRYELRQLFGEDAFYDTLEDVMQDYRKQTGKTAD